MEYHPEYVTMTQAGIDPTAAKGMVLKKATFRTLQDEEIVVEYDSNAPCRICGLPVIEASMGGTDVCPWCDIGCDRDGKKWTWRELMKRMK